MGIRGGRVEWRAGSPDSTLGRGRARSGKPTGRRCTTYRCLRLRVCLHPGLMRHALLAIPTICRRGWLRSDLDDLPTLHLEPSFHLLQSEVRRGMDGLEHDPWSGLVLRSRSTTETCAFANHTIFEVPNLHNALPIGRFVLR